MIKEGYLRITEVIAPFTGVEFVSDDLLNPAAERGTIVHEEIESMLKGFGSLDEREEIVPYVNSFEAFWECNKHQYDGYTIELEKRLYCDDLKITGAIDFIASSDHKTMVIDWKTSSTAHDKSWALQAAAYQYLLMVNGYVNPQGPTFVRLKKDGKKAALKKYDDYESSIGIFTKCLELYNYFDMNKTRRKR